MRGHIRKRNKAWEVIIYLGRDPLTAKKQYQSKTVSGRRSDAERELRAMLTALETGSYVKPTAMTLGELLESWLTDYVDAHTSPRTADGYRMIATRHLIPALGRVSLTKLQPSHVQAYEAKALREGRADGTGGLSGRSVLHHHRALYAALEYAVRMNLVARNVAHAVEPPRPEDVEMRTLGPDDALRFLETAQGSPFYEFFYLALYTGMRRGELLGLQWQDCDFEMATLSIRRTLQRRRGRWLIKPPKTRRGRRQIALAPKAVILLRRLRERREADVSVLGTTLKPETWVFAYPDGNAPYPESLTHAFTRIAHSIGLSGIRLHDLRHSHATIMLKEGIHPKIVSERLGHANIGITLDTYSHVLPGLQEAAARRFDEGLMRSEDRTKREADAPVDE